MKSPMIKFILILLLLFVNYTYAGVSVLGTRFFFNDETRRINVRVMNDNESEYLVKTSINGDDRFIISPPLMLLKKNQSNIVTIIPNEISSDKDEVFDLVVTAIPKSDHASGNAINLAIRSNFRLIYRKTQLVDDNLNKYLNLKRSPGTSINTILNASSSYITLYVACNKKMSERNRLNIFPQQEISVPRCMSDTWVTVVQDDNSVGLPIKLH